MKIGDNACVKGPRPNGDQVSLGYCFKSVVQRMRDFWLQLDLSDAPSACIHLALASDHRPVLHTGHQSGIDCSSREDTASNRKDFTRELNSLAIDSCISNVLSETQRERTVADEGYSFQQSHG
jgi:hypothetical protein